MSQIFELYAAASSYVIPSLCFNSQNHNEIIIYISIEEGKVKKTPQMHFLLENV